MRTFEVIRARDAHRYAAPTPEESRQVAVYLRKKRRQYRIELAVYWAGIGLITVVGAKALFPVEQDAVPIVVIGMLLYFFGVICVTMQRIVPDFHRKMAGLTRCHVVAGWVHQKQGDVQEPDDSTRHPAGFRHFLTIRLNDAHIVEQIRCPQRLFRSVREGERVVVICNPDGLLYLIGRSAT